MGLRPISGEYFADMGRYSRRFLAFAQGIPFNPEKEWLFEAYTYFCAQFMTVHMYFLTCCFLYIYPMYALSKKYFDKYYSYSLLFLFLAMSFWAYGTNGIRNGLATSLFLYALVFDNKMLRVLLMIGSTFLHTSLILPVLVFYLTYFTRNKTSLIVWLWVVSIPVSLVAGEMFEGIVAQLNTGDDARLMSYVGELEDGIENAKVGFRWDFIIYSSTVVFSGWYFIVKRQFQDIMYERLMHTYIINNLFWILIIRANFTNRFAYLSWFLMGIIIIYPLLKKEYFHHQNRWIALFMVLYFSITYLIMT